MTEIKKKDVLTNPSYQPNTSVPIDLEGIAHEETFAGHYDVSVKGLETLGDYLNKKTKKNTPSVAQGSSPASDSRRGTPLAQPPSIQPTFASMDTLQTNSPTAGIPQNVDTRIGTFFEAKTGDDKLLDKLGGNADLSGNNLLKDYSKKLEPHGKAGKDGPIEKQVLERLADANRYDPGPNSPFIDDPNAATESVAMPKGLFSIQRELGKFYKEASGDGGKQGLSGKKVTVEKLRELAHQMLMRATGDTVAAKQVPKGLAKATNAAIKEFFGVQLGLKGISVQQLRIGGEIPRGGGVESAATGQDEFLNIAQQGHPNLMIQRLGPDKNNPSNAVSYGQLNNFLEPFGGLASLGMVVIAASAIAAVAVTGLILSAIVGLFKTAQDPAGLEGLKDAQQPSTLAMGRYGKDTAGRSFGRIIAELLRIPITDYNFGANILRGLPILVGMPSGSKLDGASILAELGSVALNIVFSPGYYANWMRSILRDTLDTGKSFSNFAQAGGGAQAIESMFATIDAVINSTAYQTLMIAAVLGDRDAQGAFGLGDVSDADTMFPRGKIKLPDIYSNRAILRNNTSRFGTTNPLSFHTFLANQRMPTRVTKDAKFARGHEDWKLKDADFAKGVKQTEDFLEAEYFPFYLHDLRTSEVLGFPAFIETVTDEFSPNYNPVQTYGRQDPIQLYSSTSRQVGVTFKLVPYNEEDFDQIWLTVNKLIAMCYPQYSLGRFRSLEGKDSKMFIQPFSQVQAASPVVRLRVGDLFRSNYSKSGLAALFGASNIDQITKNKDEAKKNQQVTQKRQELAEAEKKAYAKLQKMLGKMKTGGQEELAGLSGIIQIAKGAKVSKIASIVTIAAVGKKTRRTQRGFYRLGSPAGIIQTPPSSLVQNGNKWKATVTADTKEGGQGIYAVDVANIELDPARAKTRVASMCVAQHEALKTATQANATQFTFVNKEFFDKDKNPVVRAFETTRGRGLAGVITSLDLDYGLADNTFEISPGRRAPKMITVSLRLAVIHDLPLGLDYNGDLRNPSHPIGKYAGSFGDPWEDGTDPYKAPSFAELYEGPKTNPGKITDAAKITAAEENRTKLLDSDVSLTQWLSDVTK